MKNHKKNEINKVKITAYVLGELEESERIAVERALESNPELRELAREIQASVNLTRETLREFHALESGADIALSEEQRTAIQSEIGESGKDAEELQETFDLPKRRVWGLSAVFWTYAKVAAVVVVAAGITWKVVPQVKQESPGALRIIESRPDEGADEVDVEQLRAYGYLQGDDEPASDERIGGREYENAAASSQPPRRQNETKPSSSSVAQGESSDLRKTEAPRDTALSSPAAPVEIFSEETQTKEILDEDLFEHIPERGRSYQSYLEMVPGVIEGNEKLSATGHTVDGLDTSDPMKGTFGANYNQDAIENMEVLTGGYEAEYGEYQGGLAGGKDEGSPYDDPNQVYWPGHDTEAYDRIEENEFLSPADPQNALSTFSIDVDTASYANVRRFLNQGTHPRPDAVRIEEMVNYFSYDYELPRGEIPFSTNVVIAGCPWKPEHRLARIGLKGWEIPAERRPASNLVFLIDVSGSMSPANKLPLLREAMKLLVSQLTEKDRVAIVVYAGSSGLVLPSTPGDQKGSIIGSLDRLDAGGSTNGGAGIELAYKIASENFVKDGINRVILATDGDFNVGNTSRGGLTRLIEEKAKSGVFLTVLGFGFGNVEDSTMEQLADKGAGNYAYIDTIQEAKKVLVEEMSSTLITIAKDVKIQIEFNPAQVRAYRLIGYENRVMAAEDFNDDTKDAGEIGAGHTVTALYEIVPTSVEVNLPSVDPLKYQESERLSREAASGEIFTIKLRYKKPDGDVSSLHSFPVTDTGMAYASAPPDFKFAASVASFGMILRGSQYKGSATFGSVLELAEEGLGTDRFGYRSEFLKLVRKAQSLK